MVSSTEIPNAILKTKIVDGFMGTPKYPIKPAVINKGSKFGISETIIIRSERNMYAIKTDINMMAKDRDKMRLFTKK